MINRYNFFSNQSGIALIQILVLSSILTVLAIFITSTAREQVKIAQWTEDRTLAFLASKSVESELFFALLTEPLLRSINQETDEYELYDKWNFHGEAFSTNDNVLVKLQDLNGKINAHYPKKELVLSLLQANGASYTESIVVLDSLLDWQDVDIISRDSGFDGESGAIPIRNGALPNVEELTKISGIPEHLHSLLADNLTVYGTNSFNPMNASRELLSAIATPFITEQILALRNDGMLTKELFTELTGIRESDSTYFTPTSYFEITLESRVGDALLVKKIYLQINPLATKKTPINLLRTIM
ncbi:general secretion pathway protein GspK [Thalassotalea euphylliae]|uniref:general secretion pathway protein GspK n=1 Tax=Thalassotalea euphylliae TaxID=1655234 RepID=UPI003625D4BE